MNSEVFQAWQNKFTSNSDKSTKVSLSSKTTEYREETQKNKRNDILRKRRHNFISNLDATSSVSIQANIHEIFGKLLSDIKANDKSIVYPAVIAIRDYTNLVIETQFLSQFPELDDLLITILSRCAHEDLEIQKESSKIISNISTGDQLLCEKLIHFEFFKLLLKAFESFKTKLLIAAGNIVGESPTIRDQFIESSLTQNLIDYIDQYHSHQGIWALCNLVRGIPPPKPEFCKIIFPALVQKASNFQTPDEKSMAEDCMWTLVDVTDIEGSEHIEYFLNENSLLVSICKLLESNDLQLISPVLKFLTNVLSRNMQACNDFMEKGLLEKLFSLSNMKNKQVKMEVLTALASFLSENSDLIEVFITKTQFVPRLLYMMKFEHKDVVTQACWVMYKIIKSSNESQAKQLYYLKAFETVCELLEDPEARILRIVLDCIYEFLRIGDQFLDQDGENFFVLALGETKDLDKLENLQDHPQESIRKKALNILETFFEPDE